MGVSAARNGLWQRHDMLASLAGLAKSRCLAENMGGFSGRLGLVRRDRLVHFSHGQLFGTGAFWGAKTGPNPTDRSKNGSKRHLIVDGQGTPLAIDHTGANVHDSEMAIALVDAIPPIKQPHGRPRRRPDEVLADRAYDAEDKIRKPLRKRKTTPLIAKRNRKHGSGLGKFRYVVEAAFDWLFNQRRLRVRYEKRDDIHQAFLIIGCFLICWRRIIQFC
jgi:transposase